MTDWRAYLQEAHGIQVHPLADEYRMLDRDALLRIGRDIVDHGLRLPIIIYTPGTTVQDRADAFGRREQWLIDGRTRIASLALALGQEDFEAHVDAILTGSAATRSDLADRYYGAAQYVDDHTAPDLKGYIESVNRHRRHLTPEEQWERDAAEVKADPARSDRTIGKLVHRSPTTIGKVRAKLEQTGDVPRLKTHRDTKGRNQPAKKEPSFFPRAKADDVSSVDTRSRLREPPPLPIRDAAPELQEISLSQVSEACDRLARVLRGQQATVFLMPLSDRVSIAREILEGLRVTVDDLRHAPPPPPDPWSADSSWSSRSDVQQHHDDQEDLPTLDPNPAPTELTEDLRAQSAEPTVPTKTEAPPKRGRGRPKGARNKPKAP